MEKTKVTLRKLFTSTFLLSAFTFGGGYVIITLMKDKFVDEFGWLEDEEMLDLVALAQSAPGPIAVNGAIVIGYKLAGVRGLLTSVFATILPPFFIITAISFFYEAFKSNTIIALMLEGMQAGIAAVIGAVVIQMISGLRQEKSNELMIILILSFCITVFFEVNVIYIILTCGVYGACKTLLLQKRGMMK